MIQDLCAYIATSQQGMVVCRQQGTKILSHDATLVDTELHANSDSGSRPYEHGDIGPCRHSPKLPVGCCKRARLSESCHRHLRSGVQLASGGRQCLSARDCGGTQMGHMRANLTVRAGGASSHTGVVSVQPSSWQFMKRCLDGGQGTQPMG